MQITLYFRCSFLIPGLFLMGVGSAWGQEQEYRPMLGEFGKWHEYFTPGPTCNATLRIDGDSIVNGVTYKKITADPGCGAILDEGSIRLLREDTLEKKVYRLHADGSEEFLLYDFSLMPGDTFFWREDRFMVLDSITDTIVNPFFCNGNNMPVLSIENPKAFYFKGAAYNRLWIEGIGSLAGLLRNTNAWGGGAGGSTLLCHFNEKRDKDFHYIFCQEANLCEGLTSDTPTTNLYESAIEVFPNPTNELIKINLDINYKELDLYLYTINGLEKIQKTNTTILDIKHFPQGIYFLKVIIDNKYFYIQKVIKQ